MKFKKFNEKYEKKIKKIDKKKKTFLDVNWVVTITLIAFLLSLFFSLFTEILISNLTVFLGIIIIFLIIVLGVIFDMIGVSIAACNLKTFNSMASKKIRGSKTAIYLIKKREKVSAFCNDVIGDVFGIISGSIGLLISKNIAVIFDFNDYMTTLLLTAFIAGLTIGGKAVGKSYAINKCDVIIFSVAKIISFFRKER